MRNNDHRSGCGIGDKKVSAVSASCHPSLQRADNSPDNRNSPDNNAGTDNTSVGDAKVAVKGRMQVLAHHPGRSFTQPQMLARIYHKYS
ncbi:hypothetical protein FHG87_019915 [Trinorchestia longiramus]|nr:hypothetical protein FHG87_019915 [Trinorchestia longiramus]